MRGPLDLPIVPAAHSALPPATPRPRRTWSAGLATLLRCLLVLAIVAGLRVAANQRQRATASVDGPNVSIELVRGTFPDAQQLAPPTSTGIREVLDQSGHALGYVLSTSPLADQVIGYRGPSQTLLLLDPQLRVVDASLLHSQDTPEHVQQVLETPRFWEQFRGLSLQTAGVSAGVDGVSGATLTSLAIGEGILLRLNGEKPSLKFPDPLQALEVQQLLALTAEQWAAARVVSRTDQAYQLEIDGEVRTVIRTGPLADSQLGYQGPSELLLAYDEPQRVVTGVRLRSSFDNEPYVDYVRTERSFWKLFTGQTLDQLATLDLDEAGIEGVSGATMTSRGVGETLIAASAERLRRAQAQAGSAQRVRWQLGAHDVGTGFVLLLGLLIGFTPLRGNHRLRTGWLLVLVAYFGLVTGNLISLAVLTGWAAHGIPWHLAPGLTAVVGVSLIVSATTKRNLYCSHLCPHGAAQQLVKHRLGHAALPATVRSWLRWLPGGLLLAAVVVCLLELPLNLSGWEPFNAYIFYVSGASSLVLAAVSLVAAARYPMVYCRYGCPTGRLLNYVRHSAGAAHWQTADWATLCCLAAVWGYVVSDFWMPWLAG